MFHESCFRNRIVGHGRRLELVVVFGCQMGRVIIEKTQKTIYVNPR